MDGAAQGRAGTSGGDGRADFERFYRAHRDRAWLYALAFTGCAETAEECLQEAFLACLERPERLRRAASPRGYLLAILRSRLVDACRRRRRERRAEEGPAWFHPNGSGVDPLVERERGRRVTAALRSLPRDQREAVVLKIWQGLTLREIAHLTGVPENTAASRYRYGIGKLRSLLQGVFDHA
jgi:RNA polymerase sigma-70 factor (ECF subfamily)